MILFLDYPRVTVGPENPVRVERDDTAILLCEVDSKPRVEEVRWVRDIRFVETKKRHLIPRANLKDAGPYICNADNGLGQVRQNPNYYFSLRVAVVAVMNFAKLVAIIFAGDCRLHFSFLLSVTTGHYNYPNIYLVSDSLIMFSLIADRQG